MTTTGAPGSGTEVKPALWPPAATPHYRRFASTDLDEIRAYTSQVFNPLNLRTPPALTGVAFSHAQASLDRLSFNFVDYGHSDGYVDVSIPDMEGCFYLQFSLTGTCEVLGSAVPAIMGPGSAFVIQPDRPCRLRLQPGYKSLIVRGDHAALERLLARELGREPARPLQFETSSTASSGTADTLASLVSLVCRDLNGERPSLASPALSRQTEEMILLLMLRCLAHNYTAALRRAPDAPCPSFIRRAETYIAAHLRDPITLDDIVRHARISARALHAGFRRYRDTTPMAFLKAARLDLSREDLSSREASGKSVTEIALNCGFTHLSRFSAEYKRRFGELPSATRCGTGRTGNRSVSRVTP